MKEHNNILRILKETEKAIKRGDEAEIANLSDQTTNTASLTQDPDNITVAVIIYSISKILERKDYHKLRGWETFYRIVISSLERAIKHVKENNEKGFRSDFGMIRKAINKLSGKLRKYVQQVFHDAKINKASRIYAHGISMAQTAKLLGLTQFDLADYIGETETNEAPQVKTMTPKKRIKLAMEMFE